MLVIVLFLIVLKSPLLSNRRNNESISTTTPSNAFLKHYVNKDLGFEFYYDHASNFLFDNKLDNDNTYLLKLTHTDLGNKLYFTLEIKEGVPCGIQFGGLQNRKITPMTIAAINTELIQGIGAYDTPTMSTCINRNGDSYWFVNEVDPIDTSSVVKSQSLFAEILKSFNFISKK